MDSRPPDTKPSGKSGKTGPTDAEPGFEDYIDQQGKDHNTPGYPANLPQQPVVRVSWLEAQAFCQWLGQRTGRRCALPTEAQAYYRVMR